MRAAWLHWLLLEPGTGSACLLNLPEAVSMPWLLPLPPWPAMACFSPALWGGPPCPPVMALRGYLENPGIPCFSRSLVLVS